MNYKEAAKILFDAQKGAYEIIKLSQNNPDLTLENSYLVQDELLRFQFADGEKKVGYKMGLTSKSKMKQMGVHSPIYGILTDRMKHASKTVVDTRHRIHPKIEPEVAFFIGKTLKGNVSHDQILSACTGICAAMEIIDSRYKNFEFTLPDVIADNCSSSGFVLGDTIKHPQGFDCSNLGMILEKDGAPVQFGSTAAIYGDPIESVAELCRMLGKRNLELEAGSIVLAGAATAAVPLEKGSTYTAIVQDLGQVSIQVK
jgi:2-oxo-3-hexenedioate decarboxylase